MPKSQTLRSLEETAYRFDSSLRESIEMYYRIYKHLENLRNSLEDIVDDLKSDLGEIDVDDPNWSALLYEVKKNKNKAMDFLDNFEYDVDNLVSDITGALNKLDTLYKKEIKI